MTKPPYVFPSLFKVFGDIWQFASDGVLLKQVDSHLLGMARSLQAKSYMTLRNIIHLA